MAKLKSKIASKYSTKKPKRKFVDGGPYTDVEKELYLNDNVTYQASTPPTAMLQNQFDAQEQEKAKRMTAIYGNQFARQLDYLQDQTAASEKRKQEEKAQQDAIAAANKQTVNQQVAQAGAKAAKDIAKEYAAGSFKNAAAIAATNTALNLGTYYSPSWASLTAAPTAPASSASILVDPAMQTATSTTGDLFAGAPTVGQNLATSSGSALGQNLAAIGKSVGKSALIALPQIAGQVAFNQINELDDKKLKKEGRSQYYDDTEYSRKEYNAQLAKSTGKGATIGGTIASAIPIPGVSTGIGMAAGALIGAGVGAIKAQHQRRMTKTEDERGVKIGNKRIGKKLLFGEENVYDENLDPTVIEKRNREAQLKAMTDTATAMENARMSSMMQSDINTGFAVAKYGGIIKKLKGGVAKPIGRGAVEYVGKKHEHGGIDLPGNIEVEGGETEQNNYVFSATLKLPNGATYAQAHKNLIKSGATGEEIHQLALSQEAAAGRNPNEIKSMKFAKYGGPLRYDDGGPKKYSAEVIANAKEMGWGDDVAGYEKSGWGYHPSKFTGKEGYNIVYNIAKNAGDPFPEVTAAQWAKESDWGTKPTGKYNYFGQTAKKGESSTNLNTPRDPGGGKKKFVNYENPKDSIIDHVEKWAPKYKNAKSAEEALYILQNNGGKGRYAQGFPTEKFPQGDWEAYIKETLKIIDQQGIKTNTETNNNTTTTDTKKTTKYPPASKYQIPGPYGMMVSSDDGISPNAEGMKQIEATAKIKAEQDADILNWGMAALTGIYGGTKALVTGAAKKAGQYIDDAMSEEEAASNAGQNVGGARTSGANTNVTTSTGVPYRTQELNTNLSNFKPFGQETGLATEGQWMADAGAVTDEALGFPRPSGNTSVGPYRPENGYINVTGRTIEPTVDPRVKLNFGDLTKIPLGKYFNSEKFTQQLEEEKKKAKQKQEEVIVPEEEKTAEETTGTGTADTSGLQDKYTLPKISAGPFNRPEYPTRTTEKTTPPKEKYDLSELPADKKDYTGLLNFVPGLVAGMTPNFKTVTPSLVQGSTGSPGAIGRVTFNRETDRQLLAENARTAAAMQQAASMQGGPGALAAMGRAQLLKSEADLKATGMVQAKNAEINAREAAANASISAQNMANVNQYEARRMQQAAMNANILNTTNQYNADLKNKEKYMKYATGVEVAQNAVENYLGYKKDQDTLQRDRDVASAMDAYHTLERKDIERKILEASADKNSKYYGTDPVTARAMARQYIEEAYPDQRKLGGPKYVSRLGNLVNKRNKRF